MTIRSAFGAMTLSVLFVLCSAICARSDNAPAAPASRSNAAEPHPFSQTLEDLSARPPMARRSPTRRGRSGVPLTENDLLAGASLNDDQKAAIEKIHHDIKARMELVAKDEKETSDQKDAMLQGLYRMQMRQVFDVLTPEQRADARKRIFAARSARGENSSLPANKSTEAH